MDTSIAGLPVIVVFVLLVLRGGFVLAASAADVGATGLSLAALGTATAWCNSIVFGVLGLAIVLAGDGRVRLGRTWGELLLTWLAMRASLIAANAFLVPSLGGVRSALTGAFVLGFFARADWNRGARSMRGPSPDAPRAMPRIARRGLVPYAVVLLGLRTATFSEPILAERWPRTLLGNPATWPSPAASRITFCIVKLCKKW